MKAILFLFLFVYSYGVFAQYPADVSGKEMALKCIYCHLQNSKSQIIVKIEDQGYKAAIKYEKLNDSTVLFHTELGSIYPRAIENFNSDKPYDFHPDCDTSMYHQVKMVTKYRTTINTYLKNSVDSSSLITSESIWTRKNKITYEYHRMIAGHLILKFKREYEYDEFNRLIYSSNWVHDSYHYKSIYHYAGDSIKNYNYERIDWNWVPTSEIIDIEKDKTSAKNKVYVSRKMFRTSYYEGRRLNAIEYDISEKYIYDRNGCITSYSERGFQDYSLKIK